MNITTITSLSALSARLRERIQLGMRDDEFDVLALESFRLQFAHNLAYRTICEARNVTPENVRTWRDIPAVPTAAFKELELTSLTPKERTAAFYSSGTTAERRSRHFHSAESLALYEDSLLAWFEQNVTTNRLPMICLIPSAPEAPNSSLAYMFETVRKRFGTEVSTFLGGPSADGGWSLDMPRAVSVLRQISQRSEPCLIMGTAFAFVHLLDHLADQNLRFALPRGSLALETGGYKGRSRSLPKAQLHGLISEYLGVPGSQITCEYGMSELSSQAYAGGARGEGRVRDGKSLERLELSSAVMPTQLKLGVNESGGPPGSDEPSCFSFPPWARSQIISPETGGEVNDGETGLIRVLDLANVFSVMAIQTEDLGIKRDNGFELLGRAELAEPRGCSLMGAS